MRLRKVGVEAFGRAVKSAGEKAVFYKIPSSKEGMHFAGIQMLDGVWVPWPDNLTETEMKLYVSLYGDIPDLFSPRIKTAHYWSADPDSKFQPKNGKDPDEV